MSHSSLEQLMAQAMEHSDTRLKRLLGKILYHPEQVTQSVLKHLGTDTAVWHNSLTFLARKADEPMGSLMVLMADVMREGKTEALFGNEELTDIARLSMGVWLRGMHEDKTTLRVRAAATLGEMLEDPARQAHARSVLASIQSKASIPPVATAQDIERLTQQAMDQHKPEMEQWANGVLSEFGFEAPEDEPVHPVFAVAQAIASGEAENYLTGADWRSTGKVVETQSGGALRELLIRLERRLMDAAAPQVPGIQPQPSTPPRTPRP